MTDKTDSKEREALRSIGEEQAFEAWFKVDCPVEGANAKIAAKAAWKARASLAASAGSEPVAPEDYVPMLDDEGRMMIGASHHYTAENIRALVAEYKALEAGAPEAMERYSNSDHRTRAGVLWRVISALADEVPFTRPSPPEGMVGGWISVDERLPPPFEEVVVYPRPHDYYCEAFCDTAGKWRWTEYERNFGVHHPECQVEYWLMLPEVPAPPTSSADSGKGG